MEWGYVNQTQASSARNLLKEKAAGLDVRRQVTQQLEGLLSDPLSQNANEKGTYTGSWQANKMDGFGIFKWATGRLYVGEWANDNKDGIGILSFKGGNEYAGEFVGDKRQGYGYYQWADNRKFKGWWFDNK